MVKEATKNTVNQIEEKVIKLLSKSNLDFEINKIKDDRYNFIIKIENEFTKIIVHIGQVKDQKHKIDIFSLIRFAPEHIEILNKLTNDEKTYLADNMMFSVSTSPGSWNLRKRV